MSLADFMSESQWFKDDLLKFATQLHDWHIANRWSEKRIYEYEKNALCSFAIIRKLSQTLKICSTVKNKQYDIFSYKPTDKKIDYMNNYKLHTLYDLNNQNVERQLISFICNQIIHSFVFGIIFSENKKESILIFSSDENKDKKLYGLSSAVIIEILNNFGNCYPSEVSITRIFADGKPTGKTKAYAKCSQLDECRPPAAPPRELLASLTGKDPT